MNQNRKNFDKAYKFARQVHEGQKDRYGEGFFESHVLEVLDQLGSEKENKELAIIALLHDTIEKTQVKAEDLADKFGQRIAEAVLDLSRDPETPYFEYIRALSSNPLAVSVKRADLMANIAAASQSRLPNDSKRLEKYMQALEYLKTGKEIR
ncbi:MAG: HD domain-containing protein [Bacteroidetes bacterium]|jgi:(p)ppGpp synthase/HD superfamily hydrolase|nr:HD domain-containing protein [Bacteroidota bacterium]